MEVIRTPFEGLVVLQPRVFEDKRGYFYESYNKKAFVDQGISYDFVQDNQSLSQQGVLRGLHFQNPPWQQGKLLRVIKGAVLDVVVDIRKQSPGYGLHFSIELSEKNKTMLFVPPGFAHGFLTLENHTIFFYKCTHYYNRESEDCLLWNDPDLAINWGISDPVLSEKDKKGQLFRTFSGLF